MAPALSAGDLPSLLDSRRTVDGMDEHRPGNPLTLENAEHAVVELRHARDTARSIDRTPTMRARADQWEIDAEIDLGIAEELLRQLRDVDPAG